MRRRGKAVKEGRRRVAAGTLPHGESKVVTLSPAVRVSDSLKVIYKKQEKGSETRFGCSNVAFNQSLLSLDVKDAD
jgi:hypothetical protein